MATPLLPLQQSLHRHRVVHRLPVPLRYRRSRADGEPIAAIAGGEGDDVSAETCVRAGGDGLSARVREHGLARCPHLDRVAAFVDQAVVMAAQQDEVVEAGLAAVGPVVDMVGVDEAAGRAAGEAAARVAALERAAQGRGTSV